MIRENIDEYLKKHGIKPSYQRIKIFEYLKIVNNHPTVDTIFNLLVAEIPTLSKTTVYNTLKLFLEKKIATIVNIEDNEARYDADTSIHGHFKCKECNDVYDFNVDLSKINLKEIETFNINEYHFYLKGFCNNCITNLNILLKKNTNYETRKNKN
jgi:Fe2+ or Zn2+ uptake regulation protein